MQDDKKRHLCKLVMCSYVAKVLFKWSIFCVYHRFCQIVQKSHFVDCDIIIQAAVLKVICNSFSQN